MAKGRDAEASRGKGSMRIINGHSLFPQDATLHGECWQRTRRRPEKTLRTLNQIAARNINSDFKARLFAEFWKKVSRYEYLLSEHSRSDCLFSPVFFCS